MTPPSAARSGVADNTANAATKNRVRVKASTRGSCRLRCSSECRGCGNLSEGSLPRLPDGTGQKPLVIRLSASSDPDDSLHLLVNPGQSLWSGDEAIAGEEVAQGVFSRFGDADAGSDGDAAGAVAVIADPETASG